MHAGRDDFGTAVGADAVRWRSARDGGSSRGQSLAELALVLPVVVALIGGVIQFGLVFWAQNTLTQVVRDTGRWEATQQTTPCSNGASALVQQANIIAGNSSLLGYTTNEWPSTSPWPETYPANPQPKEGVEVLWADNTPPWPTEPPPATDECPPPDNTQVWYVTIRISHTIPLFFPGMQYLPGFSTCDGSQGGVSGPCAFLSSTAQYRMEPAP